MRNFSFVFKRVFLTRKKQNAAAGGFNAAEEASNGGQVENKRRGET